MNALSGIYARIARARREWYRAPHRQRRLDRPVISVGNLAVGGSGKTPTVAAVARLLQEQGERPAILSRGYGRRSRLPVITVSDGAGHLVDVADSGDEPQMLARALPRVPVVVSTNRYEAGRHAEALLGATVHILDDGFQHLKLARDIDLLLVSAADLDDQVLPAGRLREPLEVGSSADAVLVAGSSVERARVQSAFGTSRLFEIVPVSAGLRSIHPFGEPVLASGPHRIIAVAGIARPQRFFDSLSRCGYEVLETMTFHDHHWFDDVDVSRIEAAARANQAPLIVTTEKDAVRLEQQLAVTRGQGRDADWVYLPYAIQIEPSARFGQWIGERLAEARRNTANGSA